MIEGAEMHKNRKYEDAEKYFRKAMAQQPDSIQAKRFLAITLHSAFAADTKDPGKAQQAIDIYKEVLVKEPADNASFKAVADLLGSQGKKEELEKWLLDRAAQENVPAEQRAEALTSLAAKQNTCANEISDIEPVKTTVEKDGKAVFVFKKPAKPEDYDRLKQCATKGTEYIDKALSMESDVTKNVKSIDVKALKDEELVAKNEFIKKFESAWSYKTSLLVQYSRIAEMDGSSADKEKYKTEAESARQKFLALAEARKNIEEEQKFRQEEKDKQKPGGGGT
jgi:hypothetical protein